LKPEVYLSTEVRSSYFIYMRMDENVKVKRIIKQTLDEIES